MISKDEFLKAIDATKSYSEVTNDIYNICRKHHMDASFGIGDNLVDAVIDVLMDGMNDEYEYIAWWVFDCEYGKCNNTVIVKNDDGDKNCELDSAEKLYDFLVEYYNKD